MAAVGRDAETGRARGFAHVQFDSPEAAAKAVTLSNEVLDGRTVFIDIAEERGAGTPGGRGNSQGADPIKLCTVGHACARL